MPACKFKIVKTLRSRVGRRSGGLDGLLNLGLPSLGLLNLGLPTLEGLLAVTANEASLGWVGC